jgi:hypothetical protein
LTLALVAAASATGSWSAVVTLPDLGLVAAAEAGLDLARVALVPDVASTQWTSVVGVMLDTMDVVVAGPPPYLRSGDARRLSSRAREREAVLVVLGRGGRAWSDGVDVRLAVVGSRWLGPDQGHGRLEGRQVEVLTGGRGAAARPHRVRVWLPMPGGGVAAEGCAGAELDAGIDGVVAGAVAGAAG